MSDSIDRMRLLLVCTFVGACAVVTAPNGTAAAARSVGATVWPASSYFVRNRVPIRKQPAFIVSDKAEFDAVFGYAATMRSGSPLDVSLFATRTMLGVAEPSPSVCASTLVSVTRTRGDYTVRYTQTCPPPTTAQYLVPFVVLVPKAPIASVTFVKNGSILARMKRKEIR